MELQNEVSQSSEIGSTLIDKKTLVNVVDILKPKHFLIN